MSGRNKVKKQALYPKQAISNDAAQLPTNLLKSVSGISVKNNKPVLKAQTPNQKIYIRKLAKRHHDILFATGPAGTGKSYIACVFAIMELQAGNIDKIVITRPNVGAGDDLGFLPGDIFAKMQPWILPLLDVFKEFYQLHEIERMLKDEIIEIAPLVFMRGRTLKRAFIIADEMQNSTCDQMKMFLTRIGEGSNMVITGDVEQHDRGHGVSGLADIIERLKRREAAIQPVEEDECAEDAFFDNGYNQTTHPAMGIMTFTREDIVRHAVIDEVLSLYG